tara:strand:+ start:3085 stop:3240 length:156 start_codon:yes stop_codon:yes gene_type:complete
MIPIFAIATGTKAFSRTLWSDGATMVESVPMIMATTSNFRIMNPFCVEFTP